MPPLHLLDDASWSSLRPLSWLRPVGELRVGLLTAAERWRRLGAAPAGHLTQAHLRTAFGAALADDNLVVNAAALPHDRGEWLARLGTGEGLLHGGRLLAARLGRRDAEALRGSSGDPAAVPHLRLREHGGGVSWLSRPHDLFRFNGEQLARDIDLLAAGRASAPVSPTNTVVGAHAVFLEPGAVCEASVLDARDGPLYLAAGAQVMPGCLLRGPLALGAHSTFKMGAKVYGATTVGPHCKVGGEVQNVVFQGYANKGHDGYLGNAVVGRWCNLGADTNASNLKNNYADVRTWDYGSGRFVDTGQQFCGLVMGDHAKCGINTMFNTGTVVGTAANVFGAGFPRAFVPDFAWGGAGGFSTHRLDKALETAARVMARRGLALAGHQRDALSHVFAQTAPHRRWEARSPADAPAPPTGTTP